MVEAAGVAGPADGGLVGAAEGSLKGSTAVPARWNARSPCDGQRNPGDDWLQPEPAPWPRHELWPGQAEVQEQHQQG